MFSRRFGALLLVVTLITTFSACVAPTPQVVEKQVVVTQIVQQEKVVEKQVVQTQVVEKSVEKVVTATPVPPTPMPAPVTLRVMDWQSGGLDFWTKTDQEFMAKYPWIKVEHEYVPYGQYFDKVGAYMAAGDGPDLIQFETGMGILKYADALNPLNNYVSDIMGDINGTMAFCEDFDCSKNIYGVPHTNQGHMVYYNKEVFKAAGLDPEKAPVTWKDYEEACQKIKAIGKECFAFGGKEWASLWTYCDLPNQTASMEEQRGLFLNTTKWTDPNIKNTLALFNEMVKAGWFQKGAALANVTPDSQDMFVRGDAAFFNSIISDAFNWKLWGDLMGYANFGVAKFPKIDCDYPLKGVCPAEMADLMDLHGGIAYGIPKWSKNVDPAVLYIKFVVSPETQTRYLIEGGAFPSNKNFDQSVVTAPQFATLVKWANEAKAPPFILYATPEEWDGIIRQTQLLLLGQTDPDKAAAELQKIREATLAKQ